MSAVVTLEIVPRVKSTKHAVRALRSNARIPGIVYGAGQPPETISLSQKQLGQEMQKKGFFTRLFHVVLGGKNQHLIARDVQFHPVTDVPLHVDFMRVDQKSRVTIAVPLRFTHQEKSPGLKHGGLLNVVAHTVTFSVLAASIPEEIVIDLTGAEIGHSVRLKDLQLPEGVVPLHLEPTSSLATLVAPAGIAAGETQEQA